MQWFFDVTVQVLILPVMPLQTQARQGVNEYLTGIVDVRFTKVLGSAKTAGYRRHSEGIKACNTASALLRGGMDFRRRRKQVYINFAS